MTMSGNQNSIMWPAESLLVQRAERSLGIVPKSTQHAVAVTLFEAIEDMAARLAALDQAACGLVPAGFESTGRLAFLKRFTKKVSRRLVWWYVEPRWIIQRQLADELAAFAKASVQANLAIGAELETLRSEIADIQAGSGAGRHD